jgi:hypothetical protein
MEIPFSTNKMELYLKIGCVRKYKEGGDLYKCIRYLLLLAYCPVGNVFDKFLKYKRGFCSFDLSVIVFTFLKKTPLSIG